VKRSRVRTAIRFRFGFQFLDDFHLLQVHHADGVVVGVRRRDALSGRTRREVLVGRANFEQADHVHGPWECLADFRNSEFCRWNVGNGNRRGRREVENVQLRWTRRVIVIRADRSIPGMPRRVT